MNPTPNHNLNLTTNPEVIPTDRAILSTNDVGHPSLVSTSTMSQPSPTSSTVAPPSPSLDMNAPDPNCVPLTSLDPGSREPASGTNSTSSPKHDGDVKPDLESPDHHPNLHASSSPNLNPNPKPNDANGCMLDPPKHSGTRFGRSTSDVQVHSTPISHTLI